MKLSLTSILLPMTFIFSVNCGKIPTKNLYTTSSSTPAEETVTVGVGAFSSAINILNSNPVFLQSFSSTQTFSRGNGHPLFESDANTNLNSCSLPAAADGCNISQKTKSASYANCEIGSSGLIFMGNVNLSFSRQSCLLETFGDSVTRTINLIRQLDSKSKISTSSDSHRDYRGNTLSGGSRLSKISGAYQFDVLGLRKLKTGVLGNSVSDISLQTTIPFFVADILQNSLTVFGGTLEVIHNTALYTATITTNDLGYNQSTCCYPTSGSMSVKYSGNVTGTATISFGKCGTATFTREGKVQTLTLAGCE